MKWHTLACAVLVAGCAGGAPMDNPSAPGAVRPGGQDRMEARQLELAESDCAAQGKHAVAHRDEGETVYDCSE